MSSRTILSLCLAGLVGLVALTLAWAFLAPTQLAGSTAYAIVDGSSMEPALEGGDLALLRSQADYETGDVVGYRSAALDRVVLHRIVGRDGERYVVKGDANDFRDVERPRQDEVVGRLWIAVPMAGSALAWLHDPLHAGLVVGAAAFVLLGGLAGLRRHRRSSEVRARSGRSAAAGLAGPALVVAGGLLGVFLLAAVVAFTQPRETTAEVDAAYRMHGTFSYAATAEPGVVYPSGAVETGDPVFLRLVDRLDVGFDYGVDAADAAALGGTISLAAELSDGAGWRRTILLEPARPFTGSSAVAAGTLDLRSISALLRSFERQSGTTSGSYLITLKPVVELRGTVAAVPISDSFAPSLVFRIDRLRLAPEARAGGEPDFVSEQSGAIAETRDGVVSFRGYSVSVPLLRAIAPLGVAVCALALVAAWSLRERGARPSAAAVERRYGSRIVAVKGRSRSAGSVVDVDSIEALAAIAERYDRMILHEADGTAHTYVVQDGDTIYRYRQVEDENERGLVGTPPVTAES
jgi:signal peptidase I